MFRRIYRRLYTSANYRLRTVCGGRWARCVRPVSIALLMTLRCNARCIHCDIWKEHGEEERLTLEQWKSFLAELRRWLGPVAIHITGGEALLRPDVPEIVAHATRLGFFVEFLTNGYWKDQGRIEQLALARPSRVTLSVDGIGDAHNVVRGREDFWETTRSTINTLCRMRGLAGLKFSIRLKTVVMEQNLAHAPDVAWFALSEGVEVLYQPIEQNYNTPDNPRWFEQSPTWPRDSSRAVAVADQLSELKRRGLPIVNSPADFDVMREYFRDPRAQGGAVQAHVAHERRMPCSGLSNLQVQPNGDIVTCCKRPPIGNIRSNSIRNIWRNRPYGCESGCLFEQTADPPANSTKTA